MMAQNLSTLQKKAFEKFQVLGLPTTKDEDWRYTSLTKFFPQTWQERSPQTLPQESLQLLLAQFPSCDNLIITLNGRIDLDSCRFQENIQLKRQARTELTQNDAIGFLHEALIDDESLELVMAPNSQSSLLILNLISDRKDTISSQQLKITIGAHGKLDIFQYHSDQTPELKVALNQTQVDLGPNAHAVWVDLTHSHRDAVSINRAYATLKRDASINYTAILLSGKMTRQELRFDLTESGAKASVDGLYTLEGEGHNDFFSHILHHAANTESTQLVKGVLAGQTRGVFTGKVTIQRDAQQVSAQQLNKNLLLTHKAHVNTRPQLEVLADDVKCAHGATVGQISEDELFYLQSRGIHAQEARQLLCHAFVQDVIEKIAHPQWKQFVGQLVEKEFESQVMGLL